MKHKVQELVERALHALRDEGEFPLETMPKVVVERARDPRHGDFATPVALGLGRVLRRKPRDIAERLAERLSETSRIGRVEVAGPGFINFRLSRRRPAGRSA